MLAGRALTISAVATWCELMQATVKVAKVEWNKVFTGRAASAFA